MKEKILTLIIGVLIGAIIATGGFLIYSKANSNNNKIPDISNQGQRPNGQMPEKREMPTDKKSSSNEEKSEDENLPSDNKMNSKNQKTNKEPPAKPTENSDKNTNESPTNE